MSTPSDKISSETKNCSFTLQSIKKFLSLMATQQAEYSDFSYKANGPFSLVLRAKHNGIEEVALKVLECTDRTEDQIQAMEREYALFQQLPSSDYFLAVQSQFFLTEIEESAEQGQNEKLNTARKIYFVQRMEMCEESLQDMIQHYSETNKEPPSETFKELLAIQMLDAVNLLHQKQVTHGNITTQHFLAVSSKDYQLILKLCNLRFTSPVNLRNPMNQGSIMQPQNLIPPLPEMKSHCLEQDLISLGKVFLHLDSIGTKFNYSTIENSDLDESELATMLETQQLNFSTFLSKMACSVLSKSRENSQTARSMLLLLLKKQTGTLKIPLFSVVLKSHLDSLRLPIPSKRIRLDFLLWQMSGQRKLHSRTNQFDQKGQRQTKLTVDLIKSALDVMLDWKEFSGQYDVLGIGIGGVVFGVENLKETRKSVLKLSLCTNKSEIIREIGIMRICQSPHIVKFYQHKFFKDANGNEFVVYELERCKYSFSLHLELQRIAGEYSDEQKNILTVQLIDSVCFLHENQILHRNVKIDSFLITEDRSGQAIVKLGNFSHAVQLQDNFEEESTLEYQLLNREYQSPINCILKRHSRESPLYFAPERWETPDLSTHLTDSFSVGLCILLLDSWLVCSEEQLAQKLLSFPLESFQLCLNTDPQISSKVDIKRITNQLLMYQPEQRTTLLNLTEKNFRSWKKNMEISKDLDKNNFQQKIRMLTLEDSQAIADFKQSPQIFSSLDTVSLNLKKSWIEDIELSSVINIIINLFKLSKISIIFNKNSILFFGNKSLLSPLACLADLQRVSLSFTENQIKDIKAQCLLSFLVNHFNLSSLNLNLAYNIIGDIGAKSLLSPLVNLLNISSLNLNLNNTQIGHQGAQNLLSPLANLFNLSSLNLNLGNNIIGNIGAQSLLSPLGNLLNLTSLNLNLEKNQIGYLGGQSLLSPLANLLNLTSLNLNLNSNQLGDLGGQSLFTPLKSLFNLLSLDINLESNEIGDIGAQSMLSPLENLLNLSNLNLNLNSNIISHLGGQSLFIPLKSLVNLLSLHLNLKRNEIGDLGAQFMLSPLANLLNLSSINLNLNTNKIGDLGASSLLSPLKNLLNLSSLKIDLNQNQIRNLGAQTLLSPLANHINLSSLNLILSYNKIGDLGAQSLLSPLVNLFNFKNLDLQLTRNEIGDLGASSLLSPLKNLLNLSSLNLNLNRNIIKDLGGQSLLSPLENLLNLSSLNLNLDNNKIGDKGAQSLLSPLGNLLSLSSFNLNLDSNEIGYLGGQSLLSPLANLLNLSNINLNLLNNKIGDVGAQYLLSPLINVLSLTSLNLNLNRNLIGYLGAQSLLSPLKNLLNLASLHLNLNRNIIRDSGAQSLLSPLENLLNLSNLDLNLENNEIGDLGAQSLLSPLANLLNLSSLTFDLGINQIRDIGAQSLLSTLANLRNLSTLDLNIKINEIGDLGASSLLSPLKNLLNLSSLKINLDSNQIGDQGAQSLLSPLENLFNLSILDINLESNKIGDLGAQSLLSPFYSLSNLTDISYLNLDLHFNLFIKEILHLFKNILSKLRSPEMYD